MLIFRLLPRYSTVFARQCSTAFFKPRRFYKEVSVSSSNENKYEILLDQRKLKTPKKNELLLNSEQLALAIAHEWDSQKETLDIPMMRLTGLAFTSIDNPGNETSGSLTEKVVEYLDTDTLLYMASSPKELCELEQKNWLPIVEWSNETYELELYPSHSVSELATIPDESRIKLYQHFHAMGFPALNGLLYGVDSIKSVLLMLACLRSRLSVEEAAKLANLEQEYQAKVYKKIEGHHDVQELELINRLAAATLFIQLSINPEMSIQAETKAA